VPIRARNLLRPDAACASADVLTPVERHVARAQRRSPRQVAPTPAVGMPRASRLRWGDVPALRQVLLALL